MKIAIFIDSLSIGGAQKHVRQVACGLAARGHGIKVYCLNDAAHPIFCDALAKGGVPLKIVGKAKVACGWGLFETAAAFRRDRPDVILTVLYVSTLFGRVLSKLGGGIPVVTCLQARNLDYTAVQKLLLRSTSPLTHLTISNSRSAIAWSVENEGVNAARCEFVPNALDIPPLDAARGALAPVSWTALGFPQLEGKTVIGSLGRLHPQKGYDVLLEALAALAAAPGVGCHVLLIGEGPERARLHDQARRLGIEDRISFAGEMADPSRLLEKMDVYVQPSRFEGTPNAVMEAMALGRPVVASAVDGIREIFGGNPPGWLVRPEDPVALAGALKEACGYPDRRQAKGLLAQAYMRNEQFSVERLGDDYERLLRSVVATGAPL